MYAHTNHCYFIIGLLQWWPYFILVIKTEKKLLRMTHCCWNNPISIIDSIILVNESNLAHRSLWKFPCQFENKDTPFHMKVVHDLSYELFYCVENSVYQMPTKYGRLLKFHCGFLTGGLKRLWVIINSDIII